MTANAALIKKAIASLISIALGVVFIFSGYAKILPVIETFEFTFVESGIGNWYTAPVMARLLIGLELFVGLLLIANYNLRKFTIPLTIGILSFFIVYLVIQIIVSGDKGDCGCFGEHHRFAMTPSQAIIKNVIMIAFSVLVRFWFDGWKIIYNKLFLSFIGITVLIVPFVVNPIDYAYTSNNINEKVNYPLDIDLLYHPEDTSKVEVPKVELRKGKHVIAFLSLTCPHCRVAAKKFRVIKKSNPSLPIYFILNGDRVDLPRFMEDTKADNIPYSFCLGKSFIQLASAALPRIYYLDNSIVVKKVDYFELNQYHIEEWIKTGKAE